MSIDREWRKPPIWLWSAMVVAIVIRGWGVLRHPVDQDELYTVVESTDLYATTLAPGIQSRPLYYMVQHALFWIMPNHEPWTRLISLSAGVFGVYLVAKLAQRIAGRSAAIVATIAVVCSPWHVYASETARYYAIIFALVTATVLYLLEARETDRISAWRRAAIPVAIGMLVHPAYTLAVAAVIPFALFRGSMSAPRWNSPSRNAWLGFVPIALLGCGLLLLSVLAAHHPGGTGNGGARLLAANLRLVPAIVEWATPALLLAGLCGVIVTVRGVVIDGDERFSMGHARPITSSTFKREASLMLGMSSVTTIVLVALASTITATYADYAVGALPGLCVGAGLLAAWATDGPRAWAIALVLVGAMAPSLASHLIDGTRFDYRPAFAMVREVDPKLLVLTWPVATGEHYASDLRRDALDRPVSELTSILDKERSLWAVVSYKRFGVASPGGSEFLKWMKLHCVETSSFEEPRFDDREYRVSVQRCVAGSH